ncbi:MAG TPA: hypothetical protein PK431_10545 [Chitinophagales bacterium]|nr:hypothetical protein [Chitinophagales bacterium]
METSKDSVESTCEASESTKNRVERSKEAAEIGKYWQETIKVFKSLMV